MTIRADNAMTIRGDGVSYMVSAGRMTFRDGEFRLEGNVRMKVVTP